ncbi:hypothetical protein D3C80_1647850 [compost metagenome]
MTGGHDRQELTLADDVAVGQAVDGQRGPSLACALHQRRAGVRDDKTRLEHAHQHRVALGHQVVPLHRLDVGHDRHEEGEGVVGALAQQFLLSPAEGWRQRVLRRHHGDAHLRRRWIGRQRQHSHFLAPRV